MDERVQAIRACPLVGNGTHSDIDDFFTDGDLAEALDFAGVVTIEEALAWARQGERIALSRVCDYRLGEDDDEELVMYREYLDRLASIS